MAILCDIKSVNFYRNSNNCVLYFVAKDIGANTMFSAKMVLDQLPSCITEQYLDFKLGSKIGTQRITKREGITAKYVDIPRFDLLEFSTMQNNQTYVNINTGSFMEQ